MTTVTVPEQIEEIFADARAMHAQALLQLERGDIRDAAEKAWCATKRATDALILSKTGEDPATIARTSDALDNLAHRESDVKVLQGRYYSRIHNLHAMCFQVGLCNDQTERRIRETAAYIDDAEALAAE